MITMRENRRQKFHQGQQQKQYLGEGGGDVALPGLIEYCADQPEVEWVRRQ